MSKHFWLANDFNQCYMQMLVFVRACCKLDMLMLAHLYIVRLWHVCISLWPVVLGDTFMIEAWKCF